MIWPPKPPSRPDKVSLLQYLWLFRRDILSAQPEKLYRAKMAVFRTAFFRSYLINQPDLIRTVLQERSQAFPKSDRISEGLRPLLGQSVFLTNGEKWQKQRRIIDPAFEGGRLRESFPAMVDAAEVAVARMPEGRVEIEAQASHAAADVIFRTLFSIPIDHHLATQVFDAFRRYQRAQPLLNLAAFLPMPRWAPRLHRRETREAARQIRRLITGLTEDRMAEIAAGRAPDDLATKIMTTTDPETGQGFDVAEMVDQVAIFFLAGHETSASALAWALYLVAGSPDVQDRLAQEVAQLPSRPAFSDLSKLKHTRNVFRETLRLYPPVPMMVRENQSPERFRDRDVPTRSQIVVSPWHVHRHTALWDNPDAFDPDRYETKAGKTSLRAAYLPFSAGPRVCTGAGFAMAEGVLLLAMMVRAFKLEIAEHPVPVAHLTVRAKDGIHLNVTRRGASAAGSTTGVT